MSDEDTTTEAEPDSVGQRIDAAIAAAKVELNARIDEVQATLAELSDKIDAAQAQGQ